MDLSGVVYRQVPCFSGAGIGSRSSKSTIHVPSSFDAGCRSSGMFRRGPSYRGCRIGSNSGFSDNGHLQYYTSPVCGEKKGKEKGQKAVSTKKKLKLLNGLSKNLSLFSEIGFGVDSKSGLVGEVQGKMISEAAEVLIKQLKKARAEEKELKRKKKEEKAKLKAMRMKTTLSSDSSSSSESGDSDRGEVIDMSRLRNQATVQQLASDESQLVTQDVTTDAVGTETMALPALVSEEDSLHDDIVECSPIAATSCAIVVVEQDIEESNTVTKASTKRVEVCMGSKCKKSGAGALMEEFERVIGVEGAVVGCKCMGKCRDAPNVRVLNSSNEIEAQNLDDSVRIPANPLYIGVGLEDVGMIVSKFFGDNRKDLGMALA